MFNSGFAKKLRSLSKGKILAGFGALGFGVAVYNFGNIVSIKEDQIGVVQDLKTGFFLDDVVTSGTHFFPLLCYIEKFDISLSPDEIKLNIESKDQQIIPVKIITYSALKGSDIPKIAQKYNVKKYKENIVTKVCTQESKEFLKQYTLLEWIEDKSKLENELGEKIRASIGQQLNFSQVEIVYDANFILKLFKHFYSEEELLNQSFYLTLKRMARDYEKIIEKE